MARIIVNNHHRLLTMGTTFIVIFTMWAYFAAVFTMSSICIVIIYIYNTGHFYRPHQS